MPSGKNFITSQILELPVACEQKNIPPLFPPKRVQQRRLSFRQKLNNGGESTAFFSLFHALALIFWLWKMSQQSDPNIAAPAQNATPIPKEVKNLIAGGLAGMVAKSFVAPIDRIKILYQVTSAPFRLRDVPKVAFKIIKQEGLSGLWKGNTATMIRVFPYAGIQFMVFNRVKSFFIDRHDRRYDMQNSVGAGGERILIRRNSIEKNQMWALTTSESLIAGSTAGAVSVLCTYPLDLTRAQLAVLKKGRRNVFLKVLGSNYSNGGVGGLFRGISPTLLGMLPYAGVAFTINERAKRQVCSSNLFDSALSKSPSM